MMERQNLANPAKRLNQCKVQGKKNYISYLDKIIMDSLFQLLYNIMQLFISSLNYDFTQITTHVTLRIFSSSTEDILAFFKYFAIYKLKKK